MMSLDRWADGGAGGLFGGGVTAAFFLLPAVSALFILFVSFAPSVNNVLLSLQRLYGGAGGGELGRGCESGRPFFLLFSVFFSALFCLLLSALLHCFYPFASLLLLPMGGGAWPFLVGGAICLVNSVNERDLSLLTSYAEVTLRGQLLRGTMAFQAKEV